MAGRPIDVELVLGVIRELSEGIGPRVGGSDGSRRACEYPAELLAGLGHDVALQPPTYVGWEYEQPPEIELVSPAAETLTGAATAFTQATEGTLEGMVWEDGVVPAIPGVFGFERLAVGEGGLPPEYHRPNDTMAIVDTAKLQTIVDVVDGVAQALDRQPPTPRA